VIHYHSPYATAVAVARKTIPNILDEGIDLTPIPTVEYCLAGSPELASNVAARFAEGRNAVLLANHGAVVVGGNLKEALNRSLEVERLAQIYCAVPKKGDSGPRTAQSGGESEEGRRPTPLGRVPATKEWVRGEGRDLAACPARARAFPASEAARANV